LVAVTIRNTASHTRDIVTVSFAFEPDTPESRVSRKWLYRK